MNKQDITIISFFVLLVVLWISWIVFKKEFRAVSLEHNVFKEASILEEKEKEPASPLENASGNRSSKIEPGEGFPQPTVEVVNGRAERTIHMGVRQYVWEPSTIKAKRGELVRLVIHNADVMHGLVIPELGVINVDIPSDGAVIEFAADKVGMFEFFCSYYCGEGHMEMQGKVIIEEE